MPTREEDKAKTKAELGRVLGVELPHSVSHLIGTGRQMLVSDVTVRQTILKNNITN
jgi:hypothetical protein